MWPVAGGWWLDYRLKPVPPSRVWLGGLVTAAGPVGAAPPARPLCGLGRPPAGRSWVALPARGAARRADPASKSWGRATALPPAKSPGPAPVLNGAAHRAPRIHHLLVVAQRHALDVHRRLQRRQQLAHVHRIAFVPLVAAEG